jgi:hypothetical protein
LWERKAADRFKKMLYSDKKLKRYEPEQRTAGWKTFFAPAVLI